MTIKAVMQSGFHTRHERGEQGKLDWLAQDSARRFMELAWVMEARRLNLRTAHRRWLRKHGRSFNGTRRAA